VAFVGYGVIGAARSIEQLNNVVLNLEMHPLANKTTNIMLFEHMNEKGEFVPTERHQQFLDDTLAALKEWTELFKTLRKA
jgi:NAD(P)H-dependent FMN reductase